MGATGKQNFFSQSTAPAARRGECTVLPGAAAFRRARRLVKSHVRSREKPCQTDYKLDAQGATRATRSETTGHRADSKRAWSPGMVQSLSLAYST